MIYNLAWWAPALLLALGLAWVNGPGLACRLPEPPDGPGLGKLPYACLATPRRLAGLAVLVLPAQAALWAVPGPHRALWLVYGAAGAALVWVDACTTWLPSRLSWLVTVELAVAAGVGLWLTDDRAGLAIQLLAGAVAAFIFWWIFWRFSRGGLGFGDVRLAPLTGAVAGTIGASGWFIALLAGSALGALWGLLVARRHPAPGTTRGFAYGPALWAGPYAALIWASVLN